MRAEIGQRPAAKSFEPAPVQKLVHILSLIHILEKFLQESAAEYDYVLIDTAPVMAADDVTSLAPRVDSVIFVVRAEYTSSRVARAALDMLYQRKARVLGLVFNSVRATMGDYYYLSLIHI